jgi:hypothetical protein
MSVAPPRQRLIAYLPIMRKVSDYKLIVFPLPDEVEKHVNAQLQQQGYELYGPPFGSMNCYGQALVKYEQAVSDEVPSTLRQTG